jgi:hypothetical protein
LHSNYQNKKIMILPENGSVVIIDEKPNEAFPIIKALSKVGISSTYYSGINDDEFAPLGKQIVRLVFLDLQLIDSVTDEHQIATSLIQVLKKIISPENGPYIIVIWSKNYAKYGTYVESEIKKTGNGIIPTCIVKLNKSECLDSTKVQNIDLEDFIQDVTYSLTDVIEEDEMVFLKQKITQVLDDHSQFEYRARHNAVEIIESAIEEQLKKAGVFHLFTIWENLIKKSGANTVAAISSTMEFSDLWEQNMRDIIKRMAKARTGQNVITDELALKASMATFTNSFSEELESKIRDYNFPDYIKLESPFIIAGKSEDSTLKIVEYDDNGKRKVKLLKDETTVKGKEGMSISSISQLSEGLKEPDKSIVNRIASQYTQAPHLINTKLHLEINPSSELIPGNVYLIPVLEEVKKQFLLSYFDKLPLDIINYHFIELEVSPICDYAQDKWKKSRIVSGLIYPENGLNVKSGDNFYKVKPSLLINGNSNKLVFDFHLFKSMDKEIIGKREILFRLKRELLLDIIVSLSGQINRAGIMFVE